MPREDAVELQVEEVKADVAAEALIVCESEANLSEVNFYGVGWFEWQPCWAQERLFAISCSPNPLSQVLFKIESGFLNIRTSEVLNFRIAESE